MTNVAKGRSDQATLAHDKNMAQEFLAGLDPNASKFTFQFFSDSGTVRPRIIHGTLDEVWTTVQMLNTPQQGAGVFVTINETDFTGRKNENIVRARALFVDADNEKQANHCVETFKAYGVTPSMAVKSGRGWHFYFCANIPRDQFTALQESLIAKVGTDPAVKDLPRVMRLPGTLHLKNPTEPRSVKLRNPANSPVRRWKLDELIAKLKLLPATPAPNKVARNTANIAPLNKSVASGEMPALDPPAIIKGCPFYRDAYKTGGKDHTQPLWNLAILGTTFMEQGRKVAHAIGMDHPGYTADSTDAMFDRKMREHHEKGLGWPSCKAIEGEGCKFCATCPQWGKVKSPLNLARPKQIPPGGPSFVDPYADFVGPKFPFDVLSPTLAKFVDAEHRAMGVDPSAVAMTVLTTVAGATHAETRVRAGDGWWERPTLWTALLGAPSTMKSPLIAKATKPLVQIDHERAEVWKQEYAIWQQKQK